MHREECTNSPHWEAPLHPLEATKSSLGRKLSQPFEGAIPSLESNHPSLGRHQFNPGGARFLPVEGNTSPLGSHQFAPLKVTTTLPYNAPSSTVAQYNIRELGGALTLPTSTFAKMKGIMKLLQRINEKSKKHSKENRH